MPSGRHPGGRQRAVLALACAAQFMVVLDISVVNVALPSIQRALGFDDSGLQWVINAYALTFAGFLLLGGRFADLFGRKRVFVLGLVLFSGASLAGGLANSAPLLIVARAVQGVGAAVLAPATLTVLTTTFAEGAARARALAIWTAVGIAGGTAGNLIGGVLTEFLSWRSILLINVPIGAIAILLTARSLTPDDEAGRRGRLDVAGAMLATGGLAALTYGIAHANDDGWAAPSTITALTGGAAAVALFIVVEARFARAPLIPLRLFRSRAISAGNVAMVLAGACLNPMWYFLTLYMQTTLHYSPVQTGLGFLPHTLVAIVIGVRVTPWLMRRLDNRALIVAGAVIAAAGFWWQSRSTADSGYLSGILGPAIVFSTGSALLNTPITTTVTSGIDAKDAGAASGLMNTTKQFGGALGLAVLVTITGNHLDTPPAPAAAYGRAFLTIAAILVAVAVVALTLPRQRTTRAASKPRTEDAAT
ncbi:MULTISPECIES: MFS transporter [Amycolatopsis]|uniref:MFS transporter n=1 Tax=Amycolatopsis TaxID=1813 RepID=UPI000B8B5E7C|nr:MULTISPECIES: MFS transporter [Amycolatopsis]OXM72305.1 MFS transporter [Amycolatopsis sp. KNN50.9b]